MKKKYLLNNLLAIFFLFILNSTAMAEDLTLMNPIADGYHIANNGGDITISEYSVIDDKSFVICVAEGTTTIGTDFRVETGGIFYVASGTPSEISETIDYDNDALPDYWEFTYFSSIDEDPSDDHDNDGASNVFEYTYETDPSDSSTRPYPYNYDYDGSGRIYNIQQETE